MIKKEQLVVKKVITAEEKKSIISEFVAETTGKYDIPFKRYGCDFIIRGARKIVKKVKAPRVKKEKVVKEKVIKEKVVKEKKSQKKSYELVVDPELGDEI